jgi:23S rRNA (uracil1939-C5)-methyltransferase
MANCRHFKVCTGCTRLNEPYAKQLAQKQQHVAEKLAKVLAAGAELRKVVPSPSPLAYRSSVKLCLHEDSLGRWSIGLYKQGTKQVVPIPGCPAHVPGLNKLADKIFALPGKVPAPFYNHKGRSFQRGRLKFLTLRQGGAEGRLEEQAIILSHTGVDPDAMREWLKAVGLAKLCAYHTTLTPEDGDDVIGRQVEHLSGPTQFRMELAGHTYRLEPMAFFQANYGLSHALIEAAGAFEGGGDVLLDLYGGFGAYSFPLAGKFERIYVVDGNAAAIHAANEKARAEGVANLEARAMTCEAFLDGMPDEVARRVTHVIVNPPRSGLSQRVVRRLDRRNFPRLKAIHYVSCNPETLARDIAALTAGKMGSLRLKSAQPFDMFPQTEHVEVVARLG